MWLGGDLTAANTQWIIAHAHQMGLVTYGEFISTPYTVGIEAGVDALLHMSRYELGVVPDELQRPLVDDPYGPAATTAYDYAMHLPTNDHTSATTRNSSQPITPHSFPPSAFTFCACPGIAISGMNRLPHCLILPASTTRPTVPLAN